MKTAGLFFLGFIPGMLSAQTVVPPKPLNIYGTVRGANGKKIYLLSSLETSPRDSAVIRDGKFHFNMPGDTTLYALILESARNPLLLISMPGNLRIVSDTAAFPLGEVSGEKENEAMQQYQKDFKELSARAIVLNQESTRISEADTAAIRTFRKKAQIFNASVKAAGNKFISTHREDIASLFVLMNELRSRLQPQEIKQVFTQLSPAVRSTKFGIAAKEYIDQVNFNAVGDIAPDFTEKDTLGIPVSLSSFRGKYVLVDFWASWCGPCRAENPNVLAAYQLFKDKNFTILSVSLDNKRKNWLEAIHQDGLYWTQLSDLQYWNNTVAIQYRITTIPSNLLIAPDGRILAKNIRGDELFSTIESYLK